MMTNSDDAINGYNREAALLHKLHDSSRLFK